MRASSLTSPSSSIASGSGDFSGVGALLVFFAGLFFGGLGAGGGVGDTAAGVTAGAATGAGGATGGATGGAMGVAATATGTTGGGGGGGGDVIGTPPLTDGTIPAFSCRSMRSTSSSVEAEVMAV